MYIYIYVCVCVCVCIIMKTMCSPVYHVNGLVATHALGHIRTSCAQVHELPQSHCGNNREGTLFS